MKPLTNLKSAVTTPMRAPAHGRMHDFYLNPFSPRLRNVPGVAMCKDLQNMEPCLALEMYIKFLASRMEGISSHLINHHSGSVAILGSLITIKHLPSFHYCT